ncbi:hypothetical protein CLU79DRAFT_710687, partial [Phycomyces nitens]
YLVDQNEFIVEAIVAHSVTCEVSSESFTGFPILVENVKQKTYKDNKYKNVLCLIYHNIKLEFFLNLKIEKKMCKSLSAKKCILTKEHETTIVSLIDTNPSGTVVEAINYILKIFNIHMALYSTVYDYKSEFNLVC